MILSWVHRTLPFVCHQVARFQLPKDLKIYLLCFCWLHSICLVSRLFRFGMFGQDWTSLHPKRNDFAWCSGLMAANFDLCWKSFGASWGIAGSNFWDTWYCRSECCRTFPALSALRMDWSLQLVHREAHPKTRCRKGKSSRRLHFQSSMWCWPTFPHPLELDWLWSTCAVLWCQKCCLRRPLSILRALSSQAFHIS